MTGSKSGRLFIAVVAVLLAAILGVLVALLLKKDPAPQAESRGGDGFKIGYAAEGITAIDQDSFNRAVDEMYDNQDEGISLVYQNGANSRDGKTFSCYLGNSSDNAYDMFIDIYADSAFTDEIFLSELLKPGQAFEEITLNRALEPGQHTVYAAFTQVEEEDGEQKLHAQTVITLDFYVSK